MDSKRSAGEVFVNPLAFNGSYDVSLEEQFLVRRTARKNVRSSLDNLTEHYIDSQSALLECAHQLIREAKNAESALIAERDNVRLELEALSRQCQLSSGRKRYAVLQFAQPTDAPSDRLSSQSATEIDDLWRRADDSIEENYAARFSLAQRVIGRRRIEVSAVLNAQMANCETNQQFQDGLRNLIESASVQKMDAQTAETAERSSGSISTQRSNALHSKSMTAPNTNPGDNASNCKNSANKTLPSVANPLSEFAAAYPSTRAASFNSDPRGEAGDRVGVHQAEPDGTANKDKSVQKMAEAAYGDDSTDARAANKASTPAADEMATPQRSVDSGSRFRGAPIGFESIIETPSRQFMSMTTFMPGLSSTVIHSAIPFETDEGDDFLAPAEPAPKMGRPDQFAVPAAPNEREAALSPSSLTTPQRGKGVEDVEFAKPFEVMTGEAPAPGVNPIADGYGMYMDNLKDEDENDNDVLGVGAPPARRNNLKKPRRSSTTFQRRGLVEMSPIVEVSSSSSSSSGSGIGSATVSHSNCMSANASRSRSTSGVANPNSASTADSTPHRTDRTNDTSKEMHEPFDATERERGVFDYVRHLFPKCVAMLDSNANRIESASHCKSSQPAGHVWCENPSSLECQLVNLEQSGFLRAIVENRVDSVDLQTETSMPEVLTKLVEKARRASVSASFRKNVASASFSTLNVSQSKVKHDGTFRLGSVTYDRAMHIATGAFNNCFRLHRRNSISTESDSTADLVARLFITQSGRAANDGSDVSDTERLRVEALWETYLYEEIAKRSGELKETLVNGVPLRFVAGFVQLDHAVLFRSSAAVLFQVPEGAAVTLGALLECARQTRANDATKSTTLPFNEALAHFCTVQLSELVRTLVLIGVVHTDLRADNLMVARLAFDAKAYESFRGGESFFKLTNFGSAVDMRQYGVDSKFDAATGAKRGVGVCPAVRDGCGWSFDMDVYSAARLVQALVQSNLETPDFEKRGEDWRESVPLKRRWNVPMWETYFRDSLRYQEMTTRDATLAKLDAIIDTLWRSFDLKRAEKLSSVANDIKCLREHL